MLRLLFVLLLTTPLHTAAQRADTAAVRWKKSLVGTVAGSQAAYENWTEGGFNTLSLTTGIIGKFERAAPNWVQVHDVRLALGVVKQDTLTFRKAGDEIRLETSLRYVGNGTLGRFQPTVAASLRTQFAPGFKYDRNPFKDGRPVPVQVSAFFTPAVLSQSVGLTYTPAPWLQQRFGLGAKETIVAMPYYGRLYGVPEGDFYKVEAGLESRTDLDHEIAENVRLKSSLGLFAAFNQPDLPDLTWENLLAMKVNSWLSTNLQVVTLYDRDRSRRLQFKEVLSLGVSVAFM